MKIHIVSTINGIENEGMRNISTHLAKFFEKDNIVFYSSLKNIYKIIKYSSQADVTFIFARANNGVYYVCRIIEKFCNNIYLMLVQKPQPNFIMKNNKHPLRCSYFAISLTDTNDLKLAAGHSIYKLKVGVNSQKFSPVSREKASIIKEKYGFNKTKPLVVHVGHCSIGRGLEDFCRLDAQKFERMVVASGLFENQEIVNKLNEAGVKLYIGYISDVNEIYQMADVYLFPTRSTEFVISIPLSVLEALSCGTPVVAYESFENISLIEVNSSNAIKTISSNAELQNAIEIASKLKKDISFLLNPLSWSDIAGMILQKVREQHI